MNNQLDPEPFSTAPVSRRAVLGALAWPAMVVGTPLAARAGQTPSEQIRIGFIGVKNRGMQNLEPLMKHAVAVCDVDEQVAAAARARIEAATGRKCSVYGDYRKLLENKDIDAVVISTPDHWHALQTIDACAAGKDVYCEKPLTLVVSEGRKMVQAARKYGRIVQTGSQQRSDAKFRQACELVRSGKLGKLHTVKVGISKNNFNVAVMPDSDPPAHLNYDLWLGPAPARPYNVNRVHYNFRFFWNYSGGQLTNWGAHHLDITQWALDADQSGPIRVVGEARFGSGVYYEVPDWYKITYSYPNNVTVLCSQDYPQGVTFEGEAGSMFVTRGKISATPADILQADRTVQLYESANHYRNWLDCIKSRKTPICDVEIGHRSATVCHLGNIAARTGRPLRWDAAREVVLDDPEQQGMLSYSYRSPWRLG